MHSKRLLQRRQFITGTSAAGALGMLYWPTLASAAKKPKLNQLSRKHFKALIGREFAVRKSPRYDTECPKVTLVLVDAKSHAVTERDVRSDGKTRWVNGGNRVRKYPFSVKFSAPKGTDLEQGTYKLKNPTLGNFDLFLVPAAADEESEVEYYIASFA